MNNVKKNYQSLVEEDQNIQSWRIDSSILTDECSIDKRKIN
jgi:hypothetical protein